MKANGAGYLALSIFIGNAVRVSLLYIKFSLEYAALCHIIRCTYLVEDGDGSIRVTEVDTHDCGCCSGQSCEVNGCLRTAILLNCVLRNCHLSVVGGLS